jgi:hypothetical protein
MRAPKDCALFLSDTPNSTVLELASSLPSDAGAAHELNPESLNWRYVQHPHTRFTFARFYRSAELRGFVVLDDDPSTRVCSIYDLGAKTADDARGLLALTVLRGFSSGVASLRMVVNDRHPLRECLRRMGFIPRRADSVFQVHSRSGVVDRLSWRVTQGDKDT